MTVLVVTADDDETASRVCQALTERGRDWARMDLGAFPAALSFHAYGPRWDGVFHIGARVVRLCDVSAVYYRRPTVFQFPRHLDEQQRRFATDETRQGLGGVLSALSVPFVNRPSSAADASLKPLQLQVAAEVGFSVPDTLITSSGARARAFAQAMGGTVLYKPFTTPFLRVEGVTKLVYATLVRVEDLDDVSVGVCPCQLQRFIHKQFDVRLTAVGSDCFAAVIRAGSDEAYVDWRSDYPSLSYEPIEPPAEIAEAVTRYLKRFGLVFGCFDFTVGPGPNGPTTWWFLECGANAQWAWIEQATGLPIAAAIASHLEPEVNR